MKVVSLQLALRAKEHLPEHARKPGQLHLDRITRTDQVRDPAVFAACSGAGKGSRHVPSVVLQRPQRPNSFQSNNAAFFSGE
jgi:hypothetical protein